MAVHVELQVAFAAEQVLVVKGMAEGSALAVVGSREGVVEDGGADAGAGGVEAIRPFDGLDEREGGKRLVWRNTVSASESEGRRIAGQALDRDVGPVQVAMLCGVSQCLLLSCIGRRALRRNAPVRLSRG